MLHTSMAALLMTDFTTELCITETLLLLLVPCSGLVFSLQPHTDPLLIDVGQEETMLLVKVVI